MPCHYRTLEFDFADATLDFIGNISLFLGLFLFYTKPWHNSYGYFVKQAVQCAFHLCIIYMYDDMKMNCEYKASSIVLKEHCIP